MAKKEILSPEKRRQVQTIERTRATQKEQVNGEIAKRQSFVAPDGQADVTDAEQQQGRPLLRAELVRKLQKLNPNLMYEQARNYPEFGGLYIENKEIDFATNLIKVSGKKHLCGFPHEVVSEFDVRLVINDRIPDPDIPLHWIEVPQLEGHIPGWRSTIKKLVNGGYINLTAAETEFEIYKGRSSQKWQMAVN